MQGRAEASRLFLLFGLILLLVSCGGGPGDLERGDPADRTVVEARIPPGQEDLLARMVGRGVDLPGGCRLAGALIETSIVSARYACAGDGPRLVVELHRAGVVARPDARTSGFDLVVRGRDPPTGFVDALAARVRAEEAAWRWDVGARGDGVPPEPPRRSLPGILRRILGAVGFGWTGPWLVVGALALAVVALRRGAAAPRPDVVAAAVVCAGSLVLRLALGTWGPWHVNGQGPAWVRYAWEGVATTAYGPGYAELLGPVARLVQGRPDTALFAAHAFLSSLVPVAAFVLARRAGVDRARAIVAAATLAVDPVGVRMSASESYFVPITSLLAIGAVLLLEAATCLVAQSAGRALAFGLAGSLLCAQAARIHPAAWLPVCATPLVALAVPGAVRVRERVGAAATCGATAGLTCWLTGGRWLLAVAEATLARDVVDPVFRIDAFSFSSVAAIGVVALVVGRFSAARWLVPAAALLLLADLPARRVYGVGRAWQMGSDRAFATVPSVGLAAAVPTAVAGARWFAPVAGAVAVVAWEVWSKPLERTTEQVEYAWLVPRLSSLPPGCRVASVPRSGRRRLDVPTYRVPGAAPRAHGAIDAGPAVNVAHALGADGCVYYVRTSLCSSAEGRPSCDDAERRLRLEGYERVTLPARPNHVAFPYDRAEVDVFLARVVGVADP